MLQAKMNDRVRVHYSGTFGDGTMFDSSLEREPFEFVIGQGMVIPGFEKGIVGMSVGETKKVSIACEDAYGPYKEDLVGTVDRSRIPENIELEIGIVLQMHSPDGSITNVTVKDINDEGVRLDLNHPLAGKDLIFEIKLMEVLET
ncbi:MAG TPA: peptidylprolyl isomerase [Syntrophorhabdaceae bacterium]|jgi:FKBP-type peptidyl-prolyl cis-trans isomerase 2|nr:peptidylprolyl isomerase [Syntrophorhabdaceae bacterium]HOS05942.1 peptidylprolyl isomerase [Syntrophorhabdaceae bacterium]HPL41874.1 peptidylprolyl isomerase [Syntrophorhabdaceae bacterium]HQM77120.1 peptidylprolyl isomerase [Syntrophorhabdaceae bacterium]